MQFIHYSNRKCFTEKRIHTNVLMQKYDSTVNHQFKIIILEAVELVTLSTQDNLAWVVFLHTRNWTTTNLYYWMSAKLTPATMLYSTMNSQLCVISKCTHKEQRSYLIINRCNTLLKWGVTLCITTKHCTTIIVWDH